MTLALLLTAVTGAWADSKVTVKELTASEITAWATDNNPLTAADLPGFVEATTEQAQSWDGYPTNGIAYLIYGFDNGETKKITYYSGNAQTPSQDSKTRAGVYSDMNRSTPDRYFYVTGIEAPVTVAWNASTKTGTFDMPGSDVVLTPIYAKAATFATTGTESDVKTLLPQALEGVIAGTDASLIADGTGIVAFAGQSTEVKQGTVMYAIGTSATEAPALTAFSATVPTAKDVADDGADVYVWYYIKGADTPEGQEATEENTFNDTEPACLTVTVLSNKFDLTLNAANANTIEAGKATVTVGGTAAPVTEGKLQGVKMGSEVKLKANTGYKFRKVEVKKKPAAEGHALSASAVREIVGSDGKAYAAADKDNLPSGVTAVAMICYVSGSHGLALALTDEEGTKDWSTAQTTCAAHTPAITGGTWKLATKDEWDNMLSAIGSYDDLRNGFGFVGGTNMQEGIYWSSTEYQSNKAYYYDFYGCYDNVFSKGNNARVRACLAF